MSRREIYSHGHPCCRRIRSDTYHIFIRQFASGNMPGHIPDKYHKPQKHQFPFRSQNLATSENMRPWVRTFQLHSRHTSASDTPYSSNDYPIEPLIILWQIIPKGSVAKFNKAPD